MGTYHEPRVPSGAPVDGERDVWLDSGKVKFGHWVAATSTWVVDKEIDYTDVAFEPAFSKHTAFNKDFGAGSTNVATGDHTHGGTFSGDADTVDGKHASAFILDADDSWHEVTTWGSAWEAAGTLDIHKLWYKKKNGMVMVQGMAKYKGGTGPVFTLPTGYRPSMHIYAGVSRSLLLSMPSLCANCGLSNTTHWGMVGINEDGTFGISGHGCGTNDTVDIGVVFPL